MKIKIILLGIMASLLLPLAWSSARLGPADAMDVLSGNTDYLPGQAADEGAMQRRKCKRGNGPGNGRGPGPGNGRFSPCPDEDDDTSTPDCDDDTSTPDSECDASV